MINLSTFVSIINQLLPEPHAGLLNGILFGTKATIPKDFMDALITTSTLHIVALSGMNITILETIIAGTLLPFIGRRWASAITILLIIGFIWFVGVSPSVIRAGIMGTFALIATIFGRQKWSLFFFGVTCVVMLAINPSWIGSLSFQLSALATLGIILFGAKSAEVALPNFRAVRFLADARAPSADISNLSKLPALQNYPCYTRFARGTRLVSFLYSLIADDLRVTLAAQSLTLPIMIFTFRRISLVSPLTNILIGWSIQPITVLGFIMAILGWIWLPLGQVVAWFTWVFLEYMILVIEVTAKIPFASLTW